MFELVKSWGHRYSCLGDEHPKLDVHINLGDTLLALPISTRENF
jgi:hypothetical protein